MLGKRIERAGPHRRGILRALRRRFERRLALDHLEAVGRHQERRARLVEPVISAADTLSEPAGAFGRANIDDEIDIAPVDAEIERRGAHHGAELALHHGRLDLAPLRHVERAVMERDRQVSVVVAPQLVKQHLGLRARIDEDQRHAVGVDRPIDFGQRVARRVPGPGQLGIRLENSDVGPGPLARHHDLGQSRGLLTSMRHQKGGKLERTCHRGRQAYRREFRRQRAEPRQIERQKIAALAGGERVQLIEDDEFEASEQLSRALVRQHQRDLLRRGQQNIGRQDALAGAARGRRVAGAGLELDR